MYISISLSLSSYYFSSPPTSSARDGGYVGKNGCEELKVGFFPNLAAEYANKPIAQSTLCVNCCEEFPNPFY